MQQDTTRSTKHTYKTKDRVTQVPLKTGGEKQQHNGCYMWHGVASDNPSGVHEFTPCRGFVLSDH